MFSSAPGVLLVGAIVLAYAPALKAGFVNWDDPGHVYESTRVVGRDALIRSLSDTSPPGFYPVLFATYQLEWRAAHGQPWLFHLDNVVLHALNALGVYALASAVGFASTSAWCVAAVWALHPAHVESIAWVTERKNVLYVFFWLIALLLYMRWSRTRRVAPYVLSLLFFAMSLLSKGAAMTLPAAIVLVEWMQQRRLDRRFWWSLVPYVALGVAGGVGLIANVEPGVRPPSLVLRVPLAARALWFYVRTFVWPADLVPVYPRWPLRSFGAVEVVSMVGAVAGAAAVVIYRVRLPRRLLFGVALFATNVVLVLGLVWNSYDEAAFVADRYLYLPAVGLAMALVAAADALSSGMRFLGAAVLPGFALVGAVLTWRQTAVWQSSAALWTYVIAHNPNIAVARYDYGNELSEQHRFADAVDEYRRARELVAAGDRSTTAIDVANNLGVALLRQERIAEASGAFDEVLRFDPRDRDAHFNLGLIATAGDDWDAAATHYEAALRDPRNDALAARSHYKLAGALVHLGKLDLAKQHYEAGARSLPDDDELLEQLAGELEEQGRLTDAVALLEARRHRPPESARFEGALAWLRATAPDDRMRDGRGAVALAERACRLEPCDANGLDILAAAYAEVGRFDDAVKMARQARDAADADLAAEIEDRLRLYEARRTYRMPVP